MCLYPRLIRNRKYTSNKKNGGIIPPVTDQRVLWVPVGCGQCMECKKQKAREWQIRLSEDVRHNKNGKFITLTFSDESIKELSSEIKGLEGYDLDNEIATIAVRRFLERWRKKYKKSIRHWLVTELGHNGTENIHMHGIIWTDADLKEVEKVWKYGIMWKGREKADGTLENYVSEKTVNYITKYINKQDENHEYYKPKMLLSAGIGRDYMKRKDSEINKYKKENTKETYTTRTGHKMSLPVYYRNKIYTEEEREKLWLEKLDKQERWVNGIRIDVSENDKQYFEQLKVERKKNKRLGYGSGEINWDKKRYENTKRKLKIKERIDRAEEKKSGLWWGSNIT